MNRLFLNIVISPDLYLKNPESSELGKKIVSQSIILINELGFEGFTFKKLSKEISSTESTIYRYFENKHTLLLYLTCWYWSWVEYNLVFGTHNINSPEERLKIALDIITKPVIEDNSFFHINEVLLHKIIINESTKVIYTKEVDNENEKGFYAVYKQIVNRLSDIIKEINPKYKYPHMLVSNTIDGALHQRYILEHFPSLVDDKKSSDCVVSFYNELVFNAIK
ncbi:TetR family transcriptional regulator [Flavobacteriales bacterium]|nr:TetR family transcriptional regulator [Flavobacteriales bacterium]